MSSRCWETGANNANNANALSQNEALIPTTVARVGTYLGSLGEELGFHAFIIRTYAPQFYLLF